MWWSGFIFGAMTAMAIFGFVAIIADAMTR
jgi:hypothetical protein